MHRTLGTILLLVVISSLCVAFPVFQSKLPNGQRIPHPCKANYLWRGLGHKNSEGGGPRNPFGEDFNKNGQVWNKCLCERDSDGDGKTNGEELGDPNCVWKEGDFPEITEGLSHPGVCEPINSPDCKEKNDWEFCNTEEFICDAINNENVTEVRMQMPLTKVPTEETTYQCMHFDLPDDKEYHIIADRPIYNNTRVMHHILVFGCEPTNDTNMTILTEPQRCSMGGDNCQKILALWSVGTQGNCFPKEYGFRVGLAGYKQVLFQVHWNNPELRDDLYDAPGMSVFITPQLRPNDGGVMMIGTTDIQIPPGAPHYSVMGSCGSACTKNLPMNLTLESVYLHMHYLGYQSAFEHVTDGIVNQVVFEENYSYDNPILYRFEEPLNFKPGDSVSITCNFQSVSKDTFTYFGDGTNDEMCFAFVNYYPEVSGFDFCTSNGLMQICGGDYVLEGCDLDGFLKDPTGILNFQGAGVYTRLSQMADVCNVTGNFTTGAETCPDGCMETITAIKSGTECLDGEIGEFVENNIIIRYFTENDVGKEFVRLLHLCDEDNDVSTSPTTVAPTPKEEESESCIFNVSNANVINYNVYVIFTILSLALWSF